MPCCPSVPGLSAPSLARHRNNRCTTAASSPVPHPAPSTHVINPLVTVAATTLSPLKDPSSEWMHKPSPQPPGSLRKQLTRELKGSRAFQRAPRAGGPPAVTPPSRRTGVQRADRQLPWAQGKAFVFPLVLGKNVFAK